MSKKLKKPRIAVFGERTVFKKPGGKKIVLSTDSKIQRKLERQARHLRKELEETLSLLEVLDDASE
jgi:membrane carboxypeptidase/penicillin-binding protein PbpC